MQNTWSIDRTWTPRKGRSRPALMVEDNTTPTPWRGGGINPYCGYDLRQYARTATGDRSTRNTRPPSGPQTGTTTRPDAQAQGRYNRICGGHGLGETPGPIPNPEAKTQHGNGTAPGRVWESSTPPPQHLNMGDILGGTFLRMPPFFIFGSDQCLAVPVLLHKAVRETIKRSWANTKGRLSLVLSAI